MVTSLIEVRQALQAVGLPVVYELALDSTQSLPCISYMETNNSAYKDGSTIAFSNVDYMVKVWANALEDIVEYRSGVDSAMRALGFTRMNTQMLGDGQDIILQCIMQYTAKAVESI